MSHTDITCMYYKKHTKLSSCEVVYEDSLKKIKLRVPHQLLLSKNKNKINYFDNNIGDFGLLESIS